MTGPFRVVRDCVRAGLPVALATVIQRTSGVGGLGESAAPSELGAKLAVRPTGEAVGRLGATDLNAAVVRDCLSALEVGRSEVRSYTRSGLNGDDVTVFIEVFPARRRMIIFGAVDFTAALVRVAKNLDYRVTVCDAREMFTTRARFPEADEVIVDWPHRYLASVGEHLGPGDAVCVLTHDQKFDIPAITAALATDVGYIGVMGSRRTHADRVERLREESVGDVVLARLMAPIGLDIGASTPEETAISIVAEIIALRAGVHAASLRDQSGPIHRGRT